MKAEDDADSELLKAKEEAMNIVINLSCYADPHVNSIIKRGTLDVLCNQLWYFDSMTVLQKAIQALANLMMNKPYIRDQLIEWKI